MDHNREKVADILNSFICHLISYIFIPFLRRINQLSRIRIDSILNGIVKDDSSKHHLEVETESIGDVDWFEKAFRKFERILNEY